MNDNLAAPALPTAPETYNAREFEAILSEITRSIEALISSGRIRANRVIVSELPQGAGAAPAGLTTGELWWDTTTNTIHVQP